MTLKGLVSADDKGLAIFFFFFCYFFFCHIDFLLVIEKKNEGLEPVNIVKCCVQEPISLLQKSTEFLDSLSSGCSYQLYFFSLNQYECLEIHFSPLKILS